MRSGLSLLLALAFAATLHASDSTRRAQEELRQKKLYFGNIDGELNSEMTEALRRYQARKGFDPTGKLDEQTLRALGVLPLSASSPAAANLERCRDFIETFFRTSEKDVGGVAQFLGDQVDYFDEGSCPRKVVLQREREKAERWPERQYKVLHLITSLHGSDPDAMIVTFRFRFAVRNGERELSGEEDNSFLLRASGRELKIVAMKAVP